LKATPEPLGTNDGPWVLIEKDLWLGREAPVAACLELSEDLRQRGA
jgi:hypothetical protein